MGAFFLIFYAINLYIDLRTQNDLILYDSTFTFCLVGFLALLFMALETYPRLVDGDWAMILPVIAIALIIVPVSGRTYGIYVKRVAEHHVTIWTKREEFPNSKIVMWFSHHVVFYTGKKVIVLPTADVVQIELEETDQNAQK
jgi:hypothetical protein